MEKLKAIKNYLIDIIYDKMEEKTLDMVPTCELGEIIDMIKDLSETMYYCSIVTTMENASYEEQEEYVEKKVVAPLLTRN